jgi:hypothetical protein
MTLPNTPIPLRPKSQQAVIEYLKECFGLYNKGINIREKLRELDIAYNREKNQLAEHKRAKAANTYGDQNRFQDLTIPVVMPQVEAAVVYQSSVFLQGTPIFGIAPSPQYAAEGLQMESLMANHATKGGWVRELQMSFRDGFKYNLAAVEVVWERKTTASLESDVNFGNGKVGKPKETIWEGNVFRKMDLYNSFWDLRVAPTRVHLDGEFAGYKLLMSRIKLKSFINELPDKIIGNIKEAFESGNGAGSGINALNSIFNYYVPELNVHGGLLDGANQGMNWMNWAGLSGADTNKIQYKNMYDVTILYARILPSDFAMIVPQANTPQIWKFIIVNNEVLIYAERQTNAHNMLPILFMQPNEDGLGYQTKSLAKNVEPIQDISSALMNSVIAARRRAVSDRGIYDPSRIDHKHINSANPSAKIPVKASAYGKPLNEAYYSIPFKDDQSPLMMQQVGMLGQFANQVSGQNPAKQGQFVKGNKTTHEFDTVMGNANGRDQATSMLLEAQFFTPAKEILKLNILQYQGTGDVYNPKQKTQVAIDPVALRKAALEFQISDGLTPTDKLINGDVLAVAFQQLGQPNSPVAAGYNLAPLFTYLMNTQGADLAPFEKSPEQQAYEQAVGQWQQVVMQIAKTSPNIKPEQYPPQPTPQQYGYQPAGNNVAKPQNQQQQQPASA